MNYKKVLAICLAFFIGMTASVFGAQETNHERKGQATKGEGRQKAVPQQMPGEREVRPREKMGSEPSSVTKNLQGERTKDGIAPRKTDGRREQVRRSPEEWRTVRARAIVQARNNPRIRVFRTRLIIRDRVIFERRRTVFFAVLVPCCPIGYWFNFGWYPDPISDWWWWYIVNSTLEYRAIWVYHHFYEIDEARYRALLENDPGLEARVRELERKKTARDSTYVPSNVEDPAIMYNDEYLDKVARENEDYIRNRQ